MDSGYLQSRYMIIIEIIFNANAMQSVLVSKTHHVQRMRTHPESQDMPLCSSSITIYIRVSISHSLLPFS